MSIVYVYVERVGTVGVGDVGGNVSVLEKDVVWRYLTSRRPVNDWRMFWLF